jgi:hypothetical protein
MNKPKQSQAIDPNESSTRDQCQTPAYGLTPLLPYLPPHFKHIWEPMAGDGLLVRALQAQGYTVTYGDILAGQNFFQMPWPDGADLLITNPAFSTKYLTTQRCCELDRPFALLMPLDFLGAKEGQELIETYQLEIICLNRRIDFKMPNAGWEGSNAQFVTFWYTRGLGIGRQLTFVNLEKPNKQQVTEQVLGIEQLTLFEMDTPKLQMGLF